MRGSGNSFEAPKLASPWYGPAMVQNNLRLSFGTMDWCWLISDQQEDLRVTTNALFLPEAEKLSHTKKWSPQYRAGWGSYLSEVNKTEFIGDGSYLHVTFLYPQDLESCIPKRKGREKECSSGLVALDLWGSQRRGKSMHKEMRAEDQTLVPDRTGRHRENLEDALNQLPYHDPGMMLSLSQWAEEKEKACPAGLIHKMSEIHKRVRLGCWPCGLMSEIPLKRDVGKLFYPQKFWQLPIFVFPAWWMDHSTDWNGLHFPVPVLTQIPVPKQAHRTGRTLGRALCPPLHRVRGPVVEVGQLATCCDAKTQWISQEKTLVGKNMGKCPFFLTDPMVAFHTDI